MQSLYYDYGEHRVHALRFGRGERLLVALHGFGDRARMFAVLDEALSGPYTVVALDLPFHGQTEWRGDSFCKEDLVAIIGQVLAREGRERFSLMGFSFGARLSQAMLPDFIDRLDKLYLLSPDGINTRGMSMAVHTPLPLRRLMRQALRRPGWFIRLARFGSRLRVMPPLIHHFLSANLTRPDRFGRTFACWFALNSFYLRRRSIQAILKESNLPTEVYFGTRDQMIHFKTLKKMTDRLPNVRLHLMDQGHRLVGEALRQAMNDRYSEGG
jgi:pimeloyl-ACP methyl ester carboxylesterase